MTHYDREKLYEEVWKEPVSSVAKKYGVSDTALAKACRRLNVPLPPRGYWSKIRSGISIKIPKLPDNPVNKPNESTKKPIKKSKQIKKDTVETSEERLQKKIKAFMQSHMVEKEDIIHHFRFLISCLDEEEYADYSDEYKKRRTVFLQDCVKRIKAAHLPTLCEPWVFYDCLESTSGFSLRVCKVEKMDIEKNQVAMEETTELFSLIEMPYTLISISEFAKIHGVSEKRIKQWIDNGKLSGAVFKDEIWTIPELHQKPYEDDYVVWLDLSDSSVEVQDYPLISQCKRLEIMPCGQSYLIEYYGKEWEFCEFITKKEKDSLMGELLKKGVSCDNAVYQIANYSAKKHFRLLVDKWHDIPSCNNEIHIS